ncbi:MAG: ATP-dependent helicase C-terminal domain-containing protein, partial [Pseudaminobacter sp.]
EKSPRAVAARQLAERLAKALPSPLRGGSDRRSGVGVEPVISPRLRLAARVDPPHKGEGNTGLLLLHAWPDRVAKARGERGRFVLANGSGAALDAADPLAGEAFLVVADLQGKAQNARIAAAASVTESEIREALPHRIETRRSTHFDRTSRAIRVRETETLGAVVLSERMLPPPSGDEANDAIISTLREHGLSLLGWSREAQALRHRLQWLHQGLGAPWPDVSDQALIASLEEWLLPFLPGEASFARVEPSILQSALPALVPPELQRRINALAPTHFDAPSGSRIPINYEGEQPLLAIRVQELFGLDRHPSIAGGTVPLTLELLSPAHRPIQTTRDLPGFWRGSWADVRSDMRGRYPKHVWPDDPLAEAATSRAKPRVK